MKIVEKGMQWESNRHSQLDYKNNIMHRHGLVVKHLMNF